MILAPHHKQQNGVALFSSLLIFSIISILITDLIRTNNINIDRNLWVIHQTQAQEYANGGEAIAISMLQSQLNDYQAGDISADEFYDFFEITHALKLERGELKLRIKDAQRLINPNSITSTAPFKAMIAQTLSYGDFDENFDQTLTDWIDSNDEITNPDGAESEYYNSLERPYGIANRRITDLSELLLVKGAHNESFQQLRSSLAALPTPTAVNINTAPPHVFELINPLLSGEDIVFARNLSPNRFANTSDFMTSESTAGVELSEELFTVNSRYFEVLATAIVSEQKSTLSSLYRVSGEVNTPQLIRRFLVPNFTESSVREQQINLL